MRFDKIEYHNYLLKIVPILEFPLFAMVFVTTGYSIFALLIMLSMPLTSVIFSRVADLERKWSYPILFSIWSILYCIMCFVIGINNYAWMLSITGIAGALSMIPERKLGIFLATIIGALPGIVYYALGLDIYAVIQIVLVNLFIGVLVERIINYLYLHQKEIERQKLELNKQHVALEKEQDKTQNMLQKIETLFGQQVSGAVVKELIAQKENVQGKSYDVTVLFLDIRDFTLFADSRPPEEVASFQNVVFGELIEIVRQHKGITNQILGDGIMAVFGAPVESHSHAVDAVAAGYAILDKVNELYEENKIPQIRVGIGLHSGNVIAGNIGNSYRKQYSITGNTVIIASRIEQLNKVYKSQFLISEDIYKEIRNNGNPIIELGYVELKGIERAVRVYQLA